MNSENESPAIDRQVLAEQVIVSAGNILRAAGFGREEIGSFFRQAAEQLEGRAGRPAPAEDPHSRICTAFAENAAVRELARQAVQARALAGDTERLKEGFDLAMQMIPRIAEAQNALRRLATEAALPLFANRAEWARRGLAETAPAVCLEDFEAPYAGAFELIGAIAEALLAREDQEAFSFLLAQLAENGVIINRRLQSTVEKGARLLGAA